jgi:hypothetical protein
MAQFSKSRLGFEKWTKINVQNLKTENTFEKYPSKNEI